MPEKRKRSDEDELAKMDVIELAETSKDETKDAFDDDVDNSKRMMDWSPVLKIKTLNQESLWRKMSRLLYFIFKSDCFRTLSAPAITSITPDFRLGGPCVTCSD